MKKITDLWINNDPRSKLLIALLFSIVAVLLASIASMLILLAMALLFCLFSRVAPSFLLKRGLLVNIFLAFVWLAVPWRIEVNPLHLAFHSEGLWLALAISLKCNAIFLAWAGLLWRANLNHILQALASWHVPTKLLALFFLFCRFSRAIMDEYILLRRAMKARGFRPGFNLHTFRSFARLISTMLLRGFDRAEKVNNAMLCRGFHGRFYFSASDLVWQRPNTIMLLGAAGVIVLAALSDFSGIFA